MLSVTSLATKLNPRVSGRQSRESKLQSQFEVLQRATFPDQPRVVIESLASGNLTDDGSFFNAPLSGFTFPAIERLPIEDLFEFGLIVRPHVRGMPNTSSQHGD